MTTVFRRAKDINGYEHPFALPYSDTIYSFNFLAGVPVTITMPADFPYYAVYLAFSYYVYIAVNEVATIPTTTLTNNGLMLEQFLEDPFEATFDVNIDTGTMFKKALELKANDFISMISDIDNIYSSAVIYGVRHP